MARADLDAACSARLHGADVIYTITAAKGADRPATGTSRETTSAAA